MARRPMNPPVGSSVSVRACPCSWAIGGHDGCRLKAPQEGLIATEKRIAMGRTPGARNKTPKELKVEAKRLYRKAKSLEKRLCYSEGKK